MPSVPQMDLTQEAAAAQQQPPARFRPSNYTPLNNTTNPPPPQVMVKPAVMLRRDERPQPVSFTVTDAAQLSRTLSEMGSGYGIPEATYSELAAILLSSGRRDQAVDISSEVMSVAEGVHQILFIPWAGRERTTFGMEEGRRGPTTNTLALKSLHPRDGSMRDNPVQAPALQMRLQGHAQGACHRCQAGRRQNPREVGIPPGPSHHQGHSHFRPMSTGAQATNMHSAIDLHTCGMLSHAAF